MKITKDIYITNENKEYYKQLVECSYLSIAKDVFLDAPLLATLGYIDLRENAKLDAPLLATSGNIYLSENAKLDAPLLATSGNIYLRENAKLDAPLLATSGNIYLRENAKLVTNKTKNLNYKSVDRSMFVIESEKSTKGINILNGYNLVSLDNGKLKKEPCFVAEKDNYFSHGETVKEAIRDLNFKIVAEKLKKEPILKDTIITIDYYRLITGACDFGVRSWMESNFNEKERIEILTNGIKANQLVPILKKTNAYGFEKFNSLVTF